MKKLTVFQKRRLLAHAARSLRLRIKRRFAAYSFRVDPTARQAQVYENGHTKRSTWVQLNGTVMPREFCLDQNFDEVIQFLESLRIRNNESILRARTQVPTRRVPTPWFDFATISHISPSAALILAAEFDRARRLSNRRLFAVDVQTWQPTVLAVLQQIGLFTVLDIDSDTNALATPDEKTVILPMRSGDQHDSIALWDLKEKLIRIAVHALGPPQGAEASTIEAWRERLLTVYTILSEAMNNVVEHAYRSVVPGPMSRVRRWWMTAAVDTEGQRLTVAIYDQGATIPYTLPDWHNFERVKSIWDRLQVGGYDPDDSEKDGLALKTALKIAVSSTNMDHRGKGLPMMADFLNSCRDGRLRIVSRRGTVTQQKGHKPVARTQQCALAGTLIEWDVFL